MQPLPQFPTQIHRYVTGIFAAANRRIGEKIARVPNTPEPSLDLTLIEHLSHYAAPRIVAADWAVRIDVHYLGGLHHFHRWEIADIGLLVFVKQHGVTVANKVAILQSKRLYPKTGTIDEETIEDYQIGFGRLIPDKHTKSVIGQSHAFAFADTSKYKALLVGDTQYVAIEAYESSLDIPVHYLLYNPWTVPVTYNVPVPPKIRLGPKSNGGCRVIPAAVLRKELASRAAGYSPTFSDTIGAVSRAAAHQHGWRLEHFVSNLLMRCREGHLFDEWNDENMFTLFSRRSGPISAALAITIEHGAG